MWFEPKERTLHIGSTATGNGQIFIAEGKYGALRLQVTGITSATITFEQCNDGGTTWDGIAGVNTETGAKATTATTDGTFLFPIPGVKKFRARISTYVTGTIYVYAVAVSADVASMEVILSSGDIEIGAVELKNATTDDRAVITAGGEVYADARKIAGVTPQFDDTDKFAVSVYGKSGAAGDTPLLVDAAGHVQVDVVSSALPTGAATSALQTTGNTALSAIQTAVETLDDGNVGKPAIISATIANGQSLSDEVNLAGYKHFAIHMPAAWTAANLTFQVAHTTGGTFYDLYDDAGIEVTAIAAATRAIAIDVNASKLAAVRYVKVRSGTTGVPVAQGAERVLTIIAKG